MTKKIFWLSTDFLNWSAYFESSAPTDEDDWRRHYEIWKHADSLLRPSASEHDLASSIFQLNRAVDFRDKYLNSLYHFRRMPGCSSKKQHEIMEELDIVKPVMRGKLDEIRNRVMHNSTERAPGFRECKELSEFVWYFLRSTDQLSASVGTGLAFSIPDPIDSKEWIEAEYDVEKWAIHLRGTVGIQRVSDSLQKEWIEIEDDPEHPSKNKGDSYYYVCGNTKASDQALFKLVEKYFRTLF